MNFDKFYLFTPIIVTIIIISLIILKIDKKVTKVVIDNWLLTQSKTYYIRSFFFLVGVALLLLSLLDLRGPEDSQDSNIPDQKTMIIIDSSASMLVEDVRPSRYKKALLLARHFVKKAVGHQISVVLFSDTQNRLVPFTDDLDLLDTRIAALEDNNNVSGGSNIAQALDESLSYFRSSNKTQSEISGNILILTDSEGHDGDLTKVVPDGINVGVVGIGTRRGGKVPIRDSRGIFRGYKKYNGKEVNSSLNEKWIASLSKKIKHYKHWIVNSYVVPTEEIVDFFRNKFIKSLSMGTVRIKPVLAHYLMIPGMLFILISFLLYPLRRFYVPCFLVLLLSNCLNEPLVSVYAQEEEETTEAEAKVMPPTEEMQDLEGLLRDGKIKDKDALYLAAEYLRTKDVRRAEIIFSEYKNKLDAKGVSNYGLALLNNEKNNEALDLLTQALKMAKKHHNNDPDLIKSIRKNIIEAIGKKKKNEKKKKDQNRDKNKKVKKKDKKKDKKKQGDEKEGEGKKKPGEEKNKKPNENKKNKRNEKKNKDNKEENDEKKREKSPEERLKEKERKQSQKRKMKKIPGLIKQILSDDRKLQKKYIDTSTKSKNNRPRKDW
jgi:Ca-activated chloride channel family protein